MKKINESEKIVFAIIVIAAMVRLMLAINYFPAGDATWHLNVARFIAENHQIPTYEFLGRDAFSYPPLFYLIAALMYNLFSFFWQSAGEIGMKLVTPIFSVFTIIVTYKLGKILFDKETALYATIFMSFIPISIFLGYISYLDYTFTFFVVFSIYFMLTKHPYLSAISIGLANNVRIYGIIIAPLLIYVLCSQEIEKKSKIKDIVLKSLVCISIIICVSAPWYIHNYNEFGNPVYPAMSNYFNNKHELAGFDASPANFLGKNYFSRLYLEIIGVPNGEVPKEIIAIPHAIMLIRLAALISMIFFAPIVLFRTKNQKTKTLFIIWAGLIASYMILIGLEVNTYFRHFLPALPIVALMWGNGFKNLQEIKFKTYNVKNILKIILIIACVVFVTGEVTKNIVATTLWQRYEPDFNWVQINTPSNAIFYWNSQALSYYIDRPTTPQIILVKRNKGFFWTQEHTDADNVMSMLPNPVTEIDSNDLQLVYENNQTTTRIYKVK